MSTLAGVRAAAHFLGLWLLAAAVILVIDAAAPDALPFDMGTAGPATAALAGIAATIVTCAASLDPSRIAREVRA